MTEQKYKSIFAGTMLFHLPTETMGWRAASLLSVAQRLVWTDEKFPVGKRWSWYRNVVKDDTFGQVIPISVMLGSEKDRVEWYRNRLDRCWVNFSGRECKLEHIPPRPDVEVGEFVGYLRQSVIDKGDKRYGMLVGYTAREYIDAVLARMEEEERVAVEKYKKMTGGKVDGNGKQNIFLYCAPIRAVEINHLRYDIGLYAGIPDKDKKIGLTATQIPFNSK